MDEEAVLVAPTLEDERVSFADALILLAEAHDKATTDASRRCLHTAMALLIQERGQMQATRIAIQTSDNVIPFPKGTD
jgi:hypothetical protein